MLWFSRFKAWVKWLLSDLFYRSVPRRATGAKGFQPGVNLIGYAHAEMGLGEALRNTALALQDAKIPFLVRKLDIPLLNRQENQSLQTFVADYCRYGINCIGINPDLLYRLPQWLPYAEWGQRYNIGYWFWELANFPREWHYAKYLIDEVWVNTDFVASAVRQCHANVFKIPFAVAFDTPAECFNRSYFGLPESSFVFLFSYDFNSSAARKNPDAVIKAFKTAFPDRLTDVCLVVKSINGEQSPQDLARLKTALSDDTRIIWVDTYLSTEEMRGLLNVADAYVSLHRAEGLGLGMAESMYLGKPVIGTAYSGNMEFMNTNNACLVPYKLIPVAVGAYPYHAGQQWAEPDVLAAAAWMVRLVNQPDFRVAIGQRAAAYMRQYHSRDVMGRAIQDRIAKIDIGSSQLAELDTGMVNAQNHIFNHKLESVVSVVVTYNPESVRFKALLANALPQVNSVVIVDNGSNPSVLEWIRQLVVPGRIELIELGGNLGIAKAQNVGIKHARDMGAAYVLLFDHDSIPEKNMVHTLMHVLLNKIGQGIKVAAVGPRYFDERQNNPPPFIEVRGLRVIRYACSHGQDCVPVSYVIASGSLIPLPTLDVVGDMREDLFIDYVDIEWGLRAAMMGYQTFGVCNALMQHDLGDAPLTFMRRSIPLHSPLRHYYLFRNAVLLYQQKNLPFLWKVGDAGRLLLKYCFYALYGRPRMTHIKMMTLGLWHGVCGRAGKLR